MPSSPFPISYQTHGCMMEIVNEPKSRANKLKLKLQEKLAKKNNS